MSNTFGTLFRLTSAGESHGPALVGIVDGMPPGIRIDIDEIKREMSSRRPGKALTSSRNEDDEVTFLSGLLDNVTLGTPIAFTIANNDSRSSDYNHLFKTFRPGHADFTYQLKYGIRDVKGGGRASARETAVRVAAGALAAQALKKRNIHILAYTSRIGKIATDINPMTVSERDIMDSEVRCPDVNVSMLMEDELRKMRQEGNTVGCTVTGIIAGLPGGIGEPVYDKLQSRLAAAMLSINAAHGFDYGDGFNMSEHYGTEMNDAFTLLNDGTIGTKTNHSGGILGGISTGMPVIFRVAFKPLPTLMQPVESIDINGNPVIIEPRGRHDVCAAPRAVAVVKAMASMTVLDMLLIAGAFKEF